MFQITNVKIRTKRWILNINMINPPGYDLRDIWWGVQVK